jgi:hypothetical protein
MGCTENIFAGAKLEWRRQWAADPRTGFQKMSRFFKSNKSNYALQIARQKRFFPKFAMPRQLQSSTRTYNVS